MFSQKGLHGFAFPAWLAIQDKQAVFGDILRLLEQKVLPVGAAGECNVHPSSLCLQCLQAVS